MKRSSLAVALALLVSGCPGVETVLERYGFSEVRPPSTLLAPGTIVWVKSRRPLIAGIVCSQEASLGHGFVSLEAPTATAEMVDALQGEFTTNLPTGSLSGDRRFAAINQVTVALRNPLVHVLSDTDVLHNVQQRDPRCTEAIEARRAAGFAVSMVASALVADVTYTVAYKPHLDLEASEKQRVIADLAPKLGIKAGRSTETTLSGDGLFWGIVDDAYLLSLTDSDSTRGMFEAPLRLLEGSIEITPFEAPDVE